MSRACFGHFLKRRAVRASSPHTKDKHWLITAIYQNALYWNYGFIHISAECEYTVLILNLHYCYSSLSGLLETIRIWHLCKLWKNSLTVDHVDGELAVVQPLKLLQGWHFKPWVKKSRCIRTERDSLMLCISQNISFVSWHLVFMVWQTHQLYCVHLSALLTLYWFQWRWVRGSVFPYCVMLILLQGCCSHDTAPFFQAQCVCTAARSLLYSKSVRLCECDARSQPVVLTSAQTDCNVSGGSWWMICVFFYPLRSFLAMLDNF